jgi:hypothetical protein
LDKSYGDKKPVKIFRPDESSTETPLELLQYGMITFICSEYVG